MSADSHPHHGMTRAILVSCAILCGAAAPLMAEVGDAVSSPPKPPERVPVSMLAQDCGASAGDICSPETSEQPFSSLLSFNARCHHSHQLYSAPNMFGDFFLGGPSLAGSGFGVAPGTGTFIYSMGGREIFLLAGGAGRLSVADNNKAITQDRVYVTYNHFHNAVSSLGLLWQLGSGTPVNSYSETLPVDRYTVGMEKAMLDGLLSMEIRVPWTGTDEGRTFGPLGIEHGETGNISFIIKTMLYETQNTGVAVGLGTETPTGSDAKLSLLPTTLHLHNDAVYLVPYVAMTGTPSSRLYYNGFFQVNVPTRGNELTVRDPNLGEAAFGRLNEATLLQVSVGGGYWLVRNRCSSWLTGLAADLEIHYTTTVNDADQEAIDLSFAGGGQNYAFSFESSDFPDGPRRDLLNLTAGLHAEMADGWLARIGGSFPLREDRSFDAEILAQFERRF